MRCKIYFTIAANVEIIRWTQQPWLNTEYTIFFQVSWIETIVYNILSCLISFIHAWLRSPRTMTLFLRFLRHSRYCWYDFLACLFVFPPALLLLLVLSCLALAVFLIWNLIHQIQHYRWWTETEEELFSGGYQEYRVETCLVCSPKWSLWSVNTLTGIRSLIHAVM